jgi:hypothetical protein
MRFAPDILRAPMSVTREQLLAWQRTNDRAYARAVRAMRWRHVGHLWTAFGLKLGHVVSPIVLGLLYLTLFLPFGVMGMLSRKPRGWIAVKRPAGRRVDELRVP